MDSAIYRRFGAVPIKTTDSPFTDPLATHINTEKKLLIEVLQMNEFDTNKAERTIPRTNRLSKEKGYEYIIIPIAPEECINDLINFCKKYCDGMSRNNIIDNFYIINPYVKILNELNMESNKNNYSPDDCYMELIAIQFDVMKYNDMSVSNQEELNNELHIDEIRMAEQYEYITKPFITHCNIYSKTLIQAFVVGDNGRVDRCTDGLDLMKICCDRYGYKYKVISNKVCDNLRRWCNEKNIEHIIVPSQEAYAYYLKVKTESQQITPEHEQQKGLGLRDYQLQCLEEMRRIHKRRAFRLPCGTGKSIIMITYILESKRNSIILVPNISLITQFEQNILKAAGDNTSSLNIICVSSKHGKLPDVLYKDKQYIVICVYNTFVKYGMKDFFKGFDMFIDEAHHIMHPSNCKKDDTVIEKVLSAKEDDDFVLDLDNTDKITKNAFSNYIFKVSEEVCNKTFYFSATINDAFSPLDMMEAIDRGYMCKLNIRILHTRTKTNRKEILSKYFKRGKDVGKSIIIYTKTCKEARELKTVLNDNFHFRAEVITASTSENVRKGYFNDFENRKLRCLLTVNCISEGVDLPHADEAIFFVDKQSIVNICQSVGRILRKPEGKLSSTLVVFSNNDSENDSIYKDIIGVLNGAFGYHGNINIGHVVSDEFLNTEDHAFRPSEKNIISTYNYEKNVSIWKHTNVRVKLDYLKRYLSANQCKLPTELEAPSLYAFVKEHRDYTDSVWRKIETIVAGLKTNLFKA